MLRSPARIACSTTARSSLPAASAWSRIQCTTKAAQCALAGPRSFPARDRRSSRPGNCESNGLGSLLRTRVEHPYHSRQGRVRGRRIALGSRQQPVHVGELARDQQLPGEVDSYQSLQALALGRDGKCTLGEVKGRRGVATIGGMPTHAQLRRGATRSWSRG
jgi:hypothetical protein